MAKIQGRLKYRLLHIIGKLRKSSFKWYQYWPQNVTCQNESEITYKYEHALKPQNGLNLHQKLNTSKPHILLK